jgi:hypothetical protein
MPSAMSKRKKKERAKRTAEFLAATASRKATEHVRSPALYSDNASWYYQVETNIHQGHIELTDVSADSQLSRGSLLGLPGELRNRIYRLVIVFSDRNDQIRISPENHSQPALLKSNRQIRKETTKSPDP